MKSSKESLLERLSNPDYREAFISDEIDIGLPMQLKAMRESRNWKQSDVAQKTDTKQPRFSLMEKPGYGKFSLNTLKKLAAVFDVGLIVSFVPYGEMIDFTYQLSKKRLAIPSFGEERSRLERKYKRLNRRRQRLNTTLPLFGKDVQAEQPQMLMSSVRMSSVRDKVVDITIGKFVPPLDTRTLGSIREAM